MAAKVGSLLIDIATDVAKLQGDMKKVERTVTGSMGKVTSTLNRVQAAFVGMITWHALKRFAQWQHNLLVASKDGEDYRRSIATISGAVDELGMVIAAKALPYIKDMAKWLDSMKANGGAASGALRALSNLYSGMTGGEITPQGKNLADVASDLEEKIAKLRAERESLKRALGAGSETLASGETVGMTTDEVVQRYRQVTEEMNRLRDRVGALNQELQRTAQAGNQAAEGISKVTRGLVDQTAGKGGSNAWGLGILSQGVRLQTDAIKKAIADYASTAEAAANHIRLVAKANDEFYQSTAENIKKANDKIAEDFADNNRKVLDQLRSWADQAGDVVAQFTQDGKLRFADMANSILMDIARMTANQALSGGLTQLLGGLFGGMMGGGGAAPLPIGVRAPTTHANGGVLNSATMVAPGHIAGEAGPEAILPLARHGGDLGVVGSAARVSVQVVDQRQSGQQVDVQSSTGPDGQTMIRMLIRDEVAGSMRRGDLDAPMRDSFGVSRRGGRR